MNLKIEPIDSVGEAITDSRTFVDPHIQDALFTKLRHEAPVRWTKPSTARPFWLISKHADIMEIERQPKLFLNAPRLQLLTLEEEAQLAAMSPGATHATRTMLHMDGAEHRANRGITNAWFLPGKIAELEGKMAILAREFIDRIITFEGSCDFVKDIAVWYPLRVIMTILGLPSEDEAELLRLTQNFVGREDRGVVGGGSREELMLRATNEIFNYFSSVYEDRIKNPHDDVASLIAHAKVNGTPLGKFETMSYYLLLGTAGHETTSATIAGGLLVLIEFPQEMEKIRANPDLIPLATDEMLRWVSPVKHFFRTATEDYTLRNQKIQAGESLMLCYPSGNRDEEVFKDPFSFNSSRNPNPHLALGSGPHACLGQNLARLEINALFRELVARIDSIELAGKPERLATTLAGGLKSLPIKYIVKPA